jgi:peptidyl-prolyl cis-trans isomerase C
MPLYVNNVEITDDAVFSEMQHHSAPSKDAARDEAAKALLIQELLRQEAIEQGLLSEGSDPDVAEKAIMELMEQKVTVPAASDDACRRYYDQNIQRFRSSETSEIPQPFPKVKGRIHDYLHTRSMRAGIQSYILDLASKARIAGFDLAASL